MNNSTCPSCGSNKVKIQTIEESRQLTLGPEFKYNVPMHICENCAEEGDFTGDADIYREQAIEKAKKELAGILIDEISKEEGLKFSYIERAFELPQRTISSKWRVGISASGLALLRIIKAMPWIVHVADNKFTSAAINKEFGKILLSSGATIETTIGDHHGIHVRITKALNQTTHSHVTMDANTMLLSTGT